MESGSAIDMDRIGNAGAGENRPVNTLLRKHVISEIRQWGVDRTGEIRISIQGQTRIAGQAQVQQIRRLAALDDAVAVESESRLKCVDHEFARANGARDIDGRGTEVGRLYLQLHLCAGTHVNRTGAINGVVTIIAEDVAVQRVIDVLVGKRRGKP